MATIGTTRVEEAKVFDRDAGFHRFKDEDGNEHGSFEVFWSDGEEEEPMTPGWYWRAGFPGCLPDGEPEGPFSSSSRAKDNALDE